MKKISFTPPATSASAQATIYLESLIKQLHSGNITRLPTIKAMATAAHVSVVTMHKVIKKFKEKGALSSAPRSGIHIKEVVGHDSKSSPSFPVRRPRWHHLKEQIEKKIIFGSQIPAPGTLLPSSKELRFQFGVGHAPLKMALTSLVNEGKLEVFRRGYRIYSPEVTVPYSTIVLIANAATIAEFCMFYPLYSEFWSLLEKEQQTLGVTIKICHHASMGPSDQPSIEPNSKNVVLGYILVTLGMSAERVVTLLDHLQKSEKPVAVFDETAMYDHLPKHQFHRNVAFFTLSVGFDAGKLTGNYLSTLGHRKVAFISHINDQWYVQSRFAGLKEALRSGFPAGEAIAFTDPSCSLQSSTTLSSFFQGGQKRKLPESIKWLEPVISSENKDKPKNFYHQYHILPYVKIVYIQELIKPLLSKVLSDPTITAWVTVNDLLGYVVADFLKAHGVKIGNNLTLCSFDNRLESVVQEITSVDFNLAMLIKSLMHYIIDFHKSSFSPQTIIEPRLIIRTSSKPVKWGAH